MYDLDEAAKRECGIWDAEHSPQHDSYVTRDFGIKEEYFVFYNPYDDEDVGKLRKWMGMVQQFSNERGVVWTAPTLSTKGPMPYQRLGSLYDVVKEIKQLVDPNNILNPGALVLAPQRRRNFMGLGRTRFFRQKTFAAGSRRGDRGSEKIFARHRRPLADQRAFSHRHGQRHTADGGDQSLLAELVRLCRRDQ